MSDPDDGKKGNLGEAVALAVALAVGAFVSPRRDEFENKKPSRDWMIIFTAISSIGALLAAIFAGWAAFETQKSVGETNRATRASVWLQVLADYQTSDMLTALNELRQWKSKNPNFDERFYELLKKEKPSQEEADQTKVVDADRRRVIKFFDKLRILTQGDIIDTYFVSSNWDSGTYTYINEVVAPLHRKKLLVMLETKAITQKDYEKASKVLEEILTFYRNTVVSE